MALGNLNCPIMLEVKPDGAGWAEIKMHIGIMPFQCKTEVYLDAMNSIIYKLLIQ